jgi:hypothetical protein
MSSAIISRNGISPAAKFLIVTSNTTQVYLPVVVESGIAAAHINNTSFVRSGSVICTQQRTGDYVGYSGTPGIYGDINDIYYQIVAASATDPYSPIIIDAGTVLRDMGKELAVSMNATTVLKMRLVKRVRSPTDTTDTSQDVYYITTFFGPGVEFTYGGTYGGFNAGPYVFDPVAVARVG